jgi:hypothetical protein
MLGGNYSKLELNVILERLIESSGQDTEARAVIASIASELRPKGGVTLDATLVSKGGKFSGLTPAHGNFEIDNDEKQTKRMQIGAGTVERVGFYKISRTTVKRFFRRKQLRVIIHQFWKAEEDTASETEHPGAWCLVCTSKMEPIWFGRFAYRPISFGPLVLTVTQIHELWGERPGRVHAHDIKIDVSVGF